MHVESWQPSEPGQFGLIFPERFWKVPHHSPVWSLTLSSYLQSPRPLACCSPTRKRSPFCGWVSFAPSKPQLLFMPRIHCPSLSHASHIAPFQKQLELDLPLVLLWGKRIWWNERQGRLRHFSKQVLPCCSLHLKEDGHLLCLLLSEWQTAQKENLGSWDN